MEDKPKILLANIDRLFDFSANSMSINNNRCTYARSFLLFIHALTCQIELSCSFRISNVKDGNEFPFNNDEKLVELNAFLPPSTTIFPVEASKNLKAPTRLENLSIAES